MEESATLTNKKQKPQRPGILTFFCIMGLIFGPIGIITILAIGSDKLPGWYSPFLIASGVAGMICLFGIFAMKRWAVIVYTVLFAVTQLILAAVGLWAPNLGLVITMFFIIFCWVYFPRMT